MMRPATWTTEAFQESVLRHGGRVDFVFGDDRPFPECHASTVAESGNGGLLCAWFGGTKEGDPDVGIWLSRQTAGTWSPPERVAKLGHVAHWNPVLFRDPARGVFLFFKVGERIANWRTYWMASDDGVDWSEATELVPGDEGGRGPVRNKPIVLSDGTWLAPASNEQDGWKPFVDRSADGGVTWERSDYFDINPSIIPGRGAIQPTLWESGPDVVHALLRTTGGCIARADSVDGGLTWTDLYATELPNNNSGIDAVKLDDGRILLVYNPVAEDWGPRTPLNLAVSDDNGSTWLDLVSIETAEGEYSYPAIIAAQNGLVISYTWKRERIRCWQVPHKALDSRAALG